EIMLQQTRVEAVKPYFERFMRSVPDIKTLAYANEEELLKLWEGLGYYNRVRNLQKAAQQIMEEYDGQMPEEYEKLCKLKGIGSYTAGAISSIAFGHAIPAVDGNVLRVLSRIREDRRSVSDTKVKEAVEKELLPVMPKDRPGDFNQAMMEIGACVCIPNGTPHCEECPLAQLCMAYQNGTQLEYPHKDRAKARSIEERTVLIIRDEGKVAIRKRAGKGLLAGMYEFPSMQGYCTAEQVVSYLAENGLKILRITPLVEAKHVFTHKEWHMKGYMVQVDELEPKDSKKTNMDWLYIEPSETREKYPIPSALEAYTQYLNIKLGNKRLREEQ
ncbi:MAG: A/G-specific adenine glycosylase, partial [Acetatifactor sp.]